MKYVPENKETDWISKEKRELFGKAVNTILMNEKNITLDLAIAQAKIIVDKAFDFYPDNGTPQEFSHPLERTEAEERKLMNSGKWGCGCKWQHTCEEHKEEYMIDNEVYDKEHPRIKDEVPAEFK